MKVSDITNYRLINQQLAGTKFKKPHEILKWLCGIQGQEYTHSKWAIGSRLPGITNEDVEKAIADRKIVRTWLMRGTLHMVAAEDIRWLLSLLGSKIKSSTASRYRELELDEKLLSRCNKILEKSLQGGNQLTREEIAVAFGKSKIKADGVRLTHILHRASIDQLICFGSRRGKEFTFTLLDEWILKSKSLKKEEALGEISNRYFLSRGPATIEDFVGWSGLSSTDAKTGLELVKSKLISETWNGKTFWLPSSMPSLVSMKQTSYLLAGFDEYLLGYKDRSACLDVVHNPKVIGSNGIFYPTVVVNGQVVGTWKAVLKKQTVSIETKLLTEVKPAEENELILAANSYAKFVGKELK